MQASYATVALHQRLSLKQIAEGATERHFPMRDRATPEWFAAAAGTGSSLDQIAPELQIDLAAGDVDWDLIRMYAPELQQSETAGVDSGRVKESDITGAASSPPSKDRDIRIDLLAELRDVDE